VAEPSLIQRPPVGNRGLRSWLRTVVRNLAANAGRSASRRASRERYAARPEAVDAELERGAMLGRKRPAKCIWMMAA
jgi:DNA-directed RNA polymerase specialized sigma24 family protein